MRTIEISSRARHLTRVSHQVVHSDANDITCVFTPRNSVFTILSAGSVARSTNDVLTKTHFPLSGVSATKIMKFHNSSSRMRFGEREPFSQSITPGQTFDVGSYRDGLKVGGRKREREKEKDKDTDRLDLCSKLDVICRRYCPSEQTFSRSTNYSRPESTSGPYCTTRRSRQFGIGSYCCSWCTPPYLRHMSPPSSCRTRITIAGRTRSTVTTPSSL